MALSTNLVSYWKQDEASASTYVDSKGVNDLTLAGGTNPQHGTGLLNNAFIPDGGMLRDFEGAASIGLDSDTFSVSMWVRNNTDWTGFKGLLVKEQSAGSHNYGLFGDSGDPEFRVADSTATVHLISGPAMSLSAWHHLVGIRTQSGVMQFWVNGTKAGEIANSGTTDFAAQTSIYAAHPRIFGIGAFGNLTNAAVDTLFDEAAYWNVALSEAEVGILYNSGAGNFFDNTVSNAFDTESPPPICWNYTAPYKGSTRVFKLSGPGVYPGSISIPGNVDTSKGKMIDDGQEIDPSDYDIN